MILLFHGFDATAQQISTEYGAAFPFLYNNEPRGVSLAHYHNSPVVYSRPEGPDLHTHYYHPALNSIPLSQHKARKCVGVGSNANDGDFPRRTTKATHGDPQGAMNIGQTSLTSRGRQ